MKLLEIRKNQLLELCQYLINEYYEYLNEDELKEVNKIYQWLLNFELDKMPHESLCNTLIPIIRKIWEFELSSGEYVVVSWNKYAGEQKKKSITFATLSKRDDIVSFCDLKEGMEYVIKYDSIIGALYKDAATLIEDESKENDYTIAMVDGKVINSYNGATKLITPKQLVAKRENEYYTNYNELILDSSKIIEIGKFDISNYSQRK